MLLYSQQHEKCLPLALKLLVAKHNRTAIVCEGRGDYTVIVCVENNQQAHDKASLDIPHPQLEVFCVFRDSHHEFTFMWSSMPWRTLNPRQDHFILRVHLGDIVSFFELTLDVQFIVKYSTLALGYCWIEEALILNFQSCESQCSLRLVFLLVPASLSASLSLFFVGSQAFIK